jgi:hypothetical protein
MNQHGVPVVMSVVGDTYVDSCRISAIIWEGVTSVGDLCEINWRHKGLRIWRGRANDDQTYLGVGFGLYGIPAPEGFKLTQLGAGTVAIYLLEV